MSLTKACWVAGWVAVVGCAGSGSASKQDLRVAAASDLTPAFEELRLMYGARTGHEIDFTFGSTGLLAKQIEEGAPFDLFAAANASFVDQVVARGACQGSTKARYARGRLVLWARKDSGLVLPSLEKLGSLSFKHLAIANPEHAPYGRAAKDALEKLGLWQALEPRVVYGENIKQTLQFAESGNAEVAIVALSLALASDGTWREIDDALHLPIDQALVVCNRGKNAKEARAFAQLVASEEGRAVMKRHGFLLPGESADKVP
jgi:molybdate transport system substrate-binding protein